MRFKLLALRPILASALLAVTSCSTDETETEPGLAPSLSPSVAAVSAYDIVKVGSSAITVDGNLSDWGSVAAIPTFSDDPANGRGSANNSASVKLAWNDTYLYAAYNISDTELLAIQTTRDAPDLYKDDEVELYIDPQGDGGTATSMTATDYQFLANIREVLGDKKGNGAGGKDASFNAASFLARVVANGTVNASGADVGYTLEFRISWSDLGVTPSAGNVMRIDLAVGDRDADVPPDQYFDWANLGNNFNNPSGWKEVQLVNPPPPQSAYDIVRVSTAGMNMDGSLNDWAGVSAISFADDAANGRGSLNNSARVKLAWNDTYLYAAYDISDTDLRAVQTTRDHPDIYKDDEVELYIDPQGDGTNSAYMTTTDYQFLANIREALDDKKGTGTITKDPSYNASSFLAKAALNGTLNSTGTDVGHSVEARIAWTDLGITPAIGHFMRIDLAVGDRDGTAAVPPIEQFDWANLGNNYNNPSGWKDVQLVGTGPTPQGIPFGIWNIDFDPMTPGPWTGGVGCCKDPVQTLNQLAAAKDSGVTMWFTPVGWGDATDPNTKDFNENLWKQSFDRHLPYLDDYQPYIADGTYQGMVLLDDVRRPGWSVSFGEIERIAEYAEARIPVPSALRQHATHLPAGSYAYLDIAWSQYNAASRGPVDGYRDDQITAASDKSVGLMFGLNILNGGLNSNNRPAGDPCIPGTDPNDATECSMSPSELKNYGTALIPYSGNCAFMMWRENANYFAKPGVLPAMDSLAVLAGKHATISCVH